VKVVQDLGVRSISQVVFAQSSLPGASDLLISHTTTLPTAHSSFSSSLLALLVRSSSSSRFAWGHLIGGTRSGSVLLNTYWWDP
jgi:hypothetical protein